MAKRKLLLSVVTLALLVIAGGALSLAGTDENGQGFDVYTNPMTRLGGPVETTLRIVPPLHDAIWPPILPIFC